MKDRPAALACQTADAVVGGAGPPRSAGSRAEDAPTGPEAATASRSTPVAGVWKPYWMALLAIPIFLAISLWNGYPLVTEDTEGYLRRPATAGAALGIPSVWANAEIARWLGEGRDRSTAAEPGTAASTAVGSAAGRSPEDGAKTSDPPHLGRSIYYGMSIYLLSLVGGLWAVVAAQAAAVGLVVALLWFRCLGLRSDLAFVALLAGLAVATSAGLFTNLIMPDIFSGLLILSLAMLIIFWRKLQRIDRVALAAIATFGVIAHMSHLLLAAGLLLGVALLHFILPLDRRSDVSRTGLWLGFGMVIGGIAATLAYGIALQSISGKAPLARPHITAHLVNHPVLGDFVREHCDGAPPKWAVCAYRERLPIDWIAFLFSRDPAEGGFATADPVQRQALSDQDAALMIAVFRNDPLATGVMMLGATGKQLAMFSYGDLSPHNKRQYINERFPPPVRDTIHKSRLWMDDSAMSLGSNVQQAVVLMSIPIIILSNWGILRSGGPAQQKILLFSAVVIFGVVVNAFVCGVLASPYDRFQSRLVWLIPLLGVLLPSALHFTFRGRKL